MIPNRLTFGMQQPKPETFPAGKVLPAPPQPAINQPATPEPTDATPPQRLGLITEMLPLDAIQMTKLTRDRAHGDDPELAELVASLRDVGLSNPIRVEPGGDNTYELIQGFRRLSAYRALLADTGDAVAWGRIPAVVVAQGMSADSLYRQMADENMVRKDISFAEMAMMALHYARDPFTSETDPERVVGKLFKSASYSKRSNIRGFLRLMTLLGDYLQFYHHIPRALGLKLSDQLEHREGLASQLIATLKTLDNRSVHEELDLLRRAVGMADDDGLMPVLRPTAVAKRPTPGTARTTFCIGSRLGPAKCTAANGQLTIRVQHDFATLDRNRLEQGVRSMLDHLR